jgi:AcrR family transcriptional regulator
VSTVKALRWERRPDARSAELMDAALEVFARNGYRNTRLEQVAEAAGVTKGTIYHYFDTKEALLLSVCRHYQSLAFDRADEVLRDRSRPASGRSRLLVQTLFGNGTPRGRLLMALLVRGVAHEVPHVHDDWLATGPVRLWTLIAQLVQEGQAAGEFRPDANGDIAARVLVSGLMLQLIWQQHADAVPALRVDESRLIDTSIEQFLAAIRPTGGEHMEANVHL